MSEIRVGTWNALNAFSDSARLKQATEVVRQMDADVVFLPETTDANGLASESYAAFADTMFTELGYHGGAVGYSPFENVRNAHTMSVWTRIPFQRELITLGDRHAIRERLPVNGLTVYGVHFEDSSEEKRFEAAEDLVNNWLSNDEDGTVVMGDYNAMYRKDPKSAIPRGLGALVGKLEVADYYDRDKKLQRIAGKVIRVSGMASGSTVALLMRAGMTDVDPEHKPTIGRWPLAFQLDRIMISQDIAARNFQVHDRRDSKGREISDHSPITAVICS